MEGNSPGYDVFGKTQVAATDSDRSGSQKGTLFQYWAQESAEKRAERVQREFEELKDARERSKLADERREAGRKSRERAQLRERQQRHRERLRNIKIASGWKPRQKRVSYISLQL
jgi:ribosomal protein L2